MTENEFFEILGYLASPTRNVKLDIETHPRKRESIESKYLELTGEELQEDNVNYYVWEEDTNKWGGELRIYFNGDLEYMPIYLRNIRVTSRPGYGYENRINNKDLVWDLIEYGFRIGNGQNHGPIRSHVPEGFMSDFEDGFNIA